jgi:hypothetical protein
MHRRAFMGALGGFGMLSNLTPASAAGEKRTRFYLVEKFDLKQGDQPARLDEFLGKMVLPELNKVHSGPKIYLDAQIAPHMPQKVAIYGVESLQQIWDIHEKMMQNKEFIRAAEEFEKKGETGEQQTNILLEAADYSPEIVMPAEPRKTPRLFEWRVYHSPSYWQLKALHERFANSEIGIFHRVGVHPILYTSTVIGPAMPNLTYLIPFESLADREKAWAAFGADPEWVKVRKESVAKYGQVSQISNISLYRATAYSPVK